MFKKYISKPVTIEAVRITEENLWNIEVLIPNCKLVDGYLNVETLEGTMTGNIGDWLIRGTEGEYYPCKDSVFQRKYKELPYTGLEVVDVTLVMPEKE